MLKWVIILLLSTLFLSVNNISGQSKIEVTGGIGFLDFINVGIKYGTKTSIGINIGIFDLTEYRLRVLTVEPCIYSHFGGKSPSSEQKLWYLKNGLTWLLPYNPYHNEIYLYYSPRIGRKLYITEGFGISIDAGIYIELWTNIQGDSWVPIVPGLGITFFYKL